MKPHAILLRAPGEIDPASRSRAAGTAGAPAILQRSDDDFVDAVLEDLRSGAGRDGLAASLATTRADGVLKLFQPVQRQFHVALLEAVCDAPGAPRIDPARIESAGMVLRRIRPGGTAREGWMRAAGRLRGWVAIDTETERDARHDPLPANRLARKAVGPPALARELATFAAQVPGALLAEHVIHCSSHRRMSAPMPARLSITASCRRRAATYRKRPARCRRVSRPAAPRFAIIWWRRWPGRPCRCRAPAHR